MYPDEIKYTKDHEWVRVNEDVAEIGITVFAEKRNTTLWFDDNFVGTELDPELSYAKVANACGLKGVTCKTMEETTKAIKQSCEDQKKGITTFIEIILNQELGEPFRRDAMKKPVEVAGIQKKDMKPQKSLI